MKAILTKPLPEIDDSIVGNVYASKNSMVTKFWLVVAIRDNTAICLGLDDDGNITSGTNYGEYVFTDKRYWNRRLVGRCEGVRDLNIKIDWI